MGWKRAPETGPLVNLAWWCWIAHTISQITQPHMSSAPLSFLLSPACLVITTKSPFLFPILFPLQLLPLCFPLPHLLPISWKISEAKARGTS